MKFNLTTFPGRPEAEYNDCAVRALSVASGLPYSHVYGTALEAGRKTRRRTSPKTLSAMASKLGLKTIKPGKKITLSRLMEDIEHVPCCAIRIAGHVVPVKYGVECDIGKISKQRARVISVFIDKSHYFGDL